MKKNIKRIIWLAKDLEFVHEKATALKKQGFDLEFVDSPKSLLETIAVFKTSNFLIGEDFFDSPKHLADIFAMPSIRACRFVFIPYLNFNSDRLTKLFAFNIRDILPVSLPNQVWNERISFAFGTQETSIKTPSTTIPLEDFSKAELPFRIIHFTHGKVRLEGAFLPKLGTRISIETNLSTKKTLTLNVKKTEHRNLKYRFGCAIDAVWKLDHQVISSKEDCKGKSKPKVLLVMRNQKVKQHYITSLRPRYHIDVAVNLTRVNAEARFFEPHVIVIEASLLQRNHRMMKNLLDHTTKTEFVLLRKSSDVFLDEGLEKEAHVFGAKDGLQFLLNLDFPVSSTKDQTFYLPRADPDSTGGLVTPCRVRQLNTDAIEFEMSIRPLKYSLLRITSPLIGEIVEKPVWVKVRTVDSNAGEQRSTYPFYVKGIICDLDTIERDKLHDKLISDIKEKLATTPHKRLVLSRKKKGRSIFDGAFKALSYLLVCLGFIGILIYLNFVFLPKYVPNFKTSGEIFQESISNTKKK